MKVTIDLRSGPYHIHDVMQSDMQKNIDALQRAIDRNPPASDFALLMDTLSILEAIKEMLPKKRRRLFHNS